ncbi:MAG: hypothetical protein IKF90_03070 [Parasporobacterium sp.]|nr:hypothetical protein [Parasporobacterium sp.]
MIKEGLYEQIINKEIKKDLDEQADSLKVFTENLDKEESPKVLGSYTAHIVEKVLSSIEGMDRRTEVVN